MEMHPCDPCQKLLPTKTHSKCYKTNLVSFANGSMKNEDSLIVKLSSQL